MGSDGPHLLRAILEQPEEDTPRLVYADWLDERGEHERAEFIRLQVELSHWQATACIYRGKPWPNSPPARCCLPGAKACEKCFRTEYIERRERGLWAVSLGWAHPFHGDLLWFSRGFVSRVTCTQADFEKHIAALFSSHPITAVTLSDVRVFPVGDFWAWRCPSHAFRDWWGAVELPEFHPTEGDARETISAACVAWGRQAAGLTPRPLFHHSTREPTGTVGNQSTLPARDAHGENA